MQRPMHGNAFHIQGFTIVGEIHNLRTVTIDVARLNRIPSQSFPTIHRLLTIGFKGPGIRVKGHLNLPTPIMAIDHVDTLFLVGEIGDGSADGQIYPDSNDTIIEVLHIFLCC